MTVALGSLATVIAFIASILGIGNYVSGKNLPDLINKTITPTPLATRDPSVLINCLPESVAEEDRIEHIDTSGVIAQSSTADAHLLSQVEAAYAKYGNRYAGLVQLFASSDPSAIDHALALDKAVATVLTGSVVMFKYARFQDYAVFSGALDTVAMEVFFFEASCQLGSP